MSTAKEEDWNDIIQVAMVNTSAIGLRKDGTIVAGGVFRRGLVVDDWTNLKQIAGGKNHYVGLRRDGTVIFYNNEIQNCLSMVSTKDSSSFTQLSTVGHDIRWEDYQRLYEEIVQLMRKELNIK